MSDLTRDELERGREVVRKIRRYRPRAVVFVGLTAYAAFERRNRARAAPPREPTTPAVAPEVERPGAARAARRAVAARRRVACGEQADRFAGARVFVVPNTSGRNAHFTPLEMRAAFRDVARALGRA
jgi:double-stranded uracil-DNA glycosylase